MARMKYRLLLVELTVDQIERAKTLNGPRKRITHAVMVLSIGQRFGTLKQCSQYYEAWSQLYYPLLLRRGEQLYGGNVEIDDYESDADLSLKLAELYDLRERALPEQKRDMLRQRPNGPATSGEPPSSLW